MVGGVNVPDPRFTIEEGETAIHAEHVVHLSLSRRLGQQLSVW